MIQFNYSDFNINKISTASSLSYHDAKNDFKIYGLKLDIDNPPVKVELPKKFNNKKLIKQLNTLFKKCNIGIEWEKRTYGEAIEIGLRTDLRLQVTLSASIIDTIINTLEGKISCKNRGVLGIPKFH